MCKRPADRAGRAGRVGRADRPFFCIALVLLRAYKRRRSGRQERTGRGDRKGRSRSDMHGVGFPTRQWQLLRSIETERFFFLHVPSIGIAAFFCIAATSFKRTVMSSAFFCFMAFESLISFDSTQPTRQLANNVFAAFFCCSSLCVCQKMRWIFKAVVVQSCSVPRPCMGTVANISDGRDSHKAMPCT